MRFLLLDSNCIFAEGERCLADTLGRSTLTGLSIADNQVCVDGTQQLLENLGGIESLDVSQSAVDL